MATTKQAKAKYQKAYNRRPSAVKKRVEANRGRRELGLKKGSDKDASHQPDGGMKGGRIGNRAGKAKGGRNSSRKGVPNK
jgi:hypothetical protein